jgi:iron complex outermembrane receptor protein
MSLFTKVRKPTFLFFCLLIYCQNSWSQTVFFTIKDKSGYTLPGANVHLKNITDGDSLSGSAEIDGTLTLKIKRPGQYQYEVSYIGYESLKENIFLKEQNNTIEVILSEAVNFLGEVTVVAKRPLIRQDGERTIVDPEPMLGSVTNTFELLTATPGLFVDQDGGVFLGSSTPAVIYINGREQRLSSNDIASILKSLPPDNILRIEIIRNPSTKYDAASSGGVVNVVLKKGVKIGRFGSTNIGFNQGRQGNRFGGLNLYNTGSNSGYYLNLNVNQDALIDDLTAERRSNAAFVLKQAGNTERVAKNGYIGFGYNQEFTDKWSFTYDGRLNGSISNSTTDFNNRTESFDGKELSVMQNLVEDRAPFTGHNHDFGGVYKLDTANSNINFKISAGQSWNDVEQNYDNIFTFPLFPSISGLGDIDRERKYLMSQMDITKQFTKDFRLETGLKSNLQKFESNADFKIKNGEEYISDIARNNAYIFNESLFAAYGQVSNNFENKISLTTGARLETTDMSGLQQIPSDTSFKVKRADLFPFLFLSRELIKIAGYSMKGFLTYRKTLSRPGYQNLNPAVRVIDNYNYQAGNPGLRPQFTNNVEFKIGFDDVEVLAFGKNYTSGIISNVLYNDPENPDLTVNTFDNIGKTDETYFKFTGALPPVFKYFFVLGGQYNHLKYNGLYNGAPISFTRGSWQFFTFHRYKITPNTTITMQGFLLHKGQRNLTELGNFGQLNFGLNQKFLDKKLTVSIYARDVFRTMTTSFRLAQANILFAGEQYRDNQRYGATIRYNFGVSPKKEKVNDIKNDEAI